MATPTQHTGLLEKYGLPTMSRNEYVNAVKKQKENEILAMPGRTGGTPTAADINYRRLGIAIGNRIQRDSPAGVELTEEQEGKFQIVETAQKRFAGMREQSPELWGGMTAEDKALTYRRFLADAADEAGDFDLATSLNDEYTQAYNARIKQNLELKKLGIDVDDSLETFQQRQYDNDVTRNHGTHVAGYPLNSDDPNSAVAGQRHSDGSFHYNDPITGRKMVAKPGEWSPTRPQRLPQERRPVNPRDRARSTTTNEVRAIRDDVVNMTSQMRTSLEMFDLMANMAQEYGSLEFMSTAGGVTTFTTKLIDNISSLTRTARELSIPFVNQEGEKVGNLNPNNDDSLRRYINSPATKGLMSDLEADFNESSHLRETFRTAEGWQASVVRLAYARARAREPGARQLSDNDIQQARAEMAAMTSDPESFRRIMLSGLGGDAAKLEQRMLLIPEDERKGMLGEEGLEIYRSLRNEFEKAYGGQGFGTSGGPGPGLTDPDKQPNKPAASAPQGNRRIIAYTADGTPIYAPQ